MKTIKISLNDGNSIKTAIKEVREYRESLKSKMELFVSRLIDVGIERAESVGGRFSKHVTYSKKLDATEYGCHGIMYGMGYTIDSTWLTKDGEQRGTLNMLWAMEFGTAAAALSGSDANRFGGRGGAGTNSVSGGHESDREWWIAVDYDSKGNIIWRRATAVEPTRPMHNAMIAMQEQIVKIAQEVFNG